MGRLTLLLVLVSFVLNINARAFDTAISSSSNSDEVDTQFNNQKKSHKNNFLQDLSAYKVIATKPLSLVSSDEDSQHEYKLGQVGGLAACVKNPSRLFVFHRASREWNQE